MTLDVINTKRLTLRYPSEDDAASLVRTLNDWEVARWLSRVPNPYQYTDAIEFIEGCRIARSKRSAFRFVIDHENQLVGGIGLEKKAASRFELGYWIARESWGKGIAAEAVISINNFAFEKLEASAITASCSAQNHRSANVLKKTKFSYKGRGQKFSRTLGKQVATIEFCKDQPNLPTRMHGV